MPSGALQMRGIVLSLCEVHLCLCSYAYAQDESMQRANPANGTTQAVTSKVSFLLFSSSKKGVLIFLSPCFCVTDVRMAGGVLLLSTHLFFFPC